MPTSELSNALNPYVTQERPRQPIAEYPTPLQQVATTPQPYVPHRSELELAVSEPQPPAPPPPNRPSTLKPRNQFSQEGVNAVQELIRLISNTKEAQEIERKRRLAWEQEQEAKFAQRQAETERYILEMRQEIQSLRSILCRNGRGPVPPQQSPQIPQASSAQPGSQQPVTPASDLLTPHNALSPAFQEQSISQHPSTPTSPTSFNQLQAVVQPTFVQGLSGEPYPSNTRPSLIFAQGTRQHISYPKAVQTQAMLPIQPEPKHVHQAGSNDQQLQRQPFIPSRTGTAQQFPGSAAQSVTPSPSPQLSVLHPQTDSPSMTSRKRKSSEMHGDDDDDDDDESGSDESDSLPTQRVRRINHHDRRCLTIQHAMRLHFLRCMELDSDKQLPDSHSEDAAFEETQPVRFVWDKTTKQSLHNARMKLRILTDIKAKRSCYKHVPEKEFGKKSLDNAFEQCFTTFRQKFKAQRDAAVATNLKQREDQKARRARHLSRRKLKLSNRAEARQKLAPFEHVTFDGALQLDCMSSEESEDETGSSKPNGVLRTRGYPWRSRRLMQFYCTLDDEERADKNTKPKRGIGKRDRVIGPPKEGFHLPPKGAATWMISRKWISTAQREQSDLSEMLSKLVIDPPGFDWEQFDALGQESGDEAEDGDMQQHGMQDMGMHQLNTMQMGYSSTSSLNYALM
ncbi:hypothetical protein AX15_002294 [Amanita polypyramis BW_CC]|nr:hypothetical protein AX15_002294 [Amanita polypyramis BW_CC]